MTLQSISALVVAALVAVSTASAQTASDTTVSPLLHNVTRVESWSFFAPPTEGGDPDYSLVSNRARLGVQVNARHVSFEGSFQYAQLLGLPSNAFGPGPLGPGSLYYDAVRTPQAYQLYFKSMSVTVKNVVPHLSMQAGRMPYESGEATPFVGRLIGTAEWTPFERAFDGVRVDYIRGAWRSHASFVMPSQGAFEESATPTMGKVKVATARITGRDVEVFAHNYRDTRAVQARPDNTGIAADRVDVQVQTFGASIVTSGVQVWGAFQRGDWYGDRHRAFSVTADVGHTWNAPWRPALRGGILYSSGDGDPNDRTHGTFFPMLPTTRPDVLRGTYAQMNLRDIYVGTVVDPSDRLQLAADLHLLSLAKHLDRWYSGTGATAFSGDYFGFSSRRSTLRTGLGTFLQLSARTVLKDHWTLSGAVGVVRGGDVVRRQFEGRTLWVMGLESALRFE